MQITIECSKCGKPIRRIEDKMGYLTMEYMEHCSSCGYWEEFAYGAYRGTDYPDSPETSAMKKM